MSKRFATSLSGVTVVMFALIGISQVRAVGSVSSRCAATTAEKSLQVVGPMLGRRPIWLVEASAGKWSPRPAKTLWVLSREVAGSLRVTGRRLDGPGVASFKDGVDAAPASTLAISDPWTRSVTPGGASPDVLKAYSFQPSYVLYPSPGCWELNARLGDDEASIVLELR